MVVRAIVRLILSLVGAVLPLFFLSGSFSPLNSYIPHLPNLLGKESALYSTLQQSFGTSLPVGILPFGTAGITGVALYGVFQRLLSSINRATYSHPKFDASKMMSSLQGQFQGLNFGRTMSEIPQGMTKAQFLVLSSYRQGQRNPKNIAKMLSIDKKSVEEQTRVLQSNGFLTKDKKLTAKGLETVS